MTTSQLSWPTEMTVRVAIPDMDLDWTAKLAATAVIRTLNAVGRAMPDGAWHARPVLTAMGSIAGRALRAGNVGMIGTTPNGQDFIANPMRIWVIARIERPPWRRRPRPDGSSRRPDASRRLLDPPTRNLRHRTHLLRDDLSAVVVTRPEPAFAGSLLSDDVWRSQPHGAAERQSGRTAMR